MPRLACGYGGRRRLRPEGEGARAVLQDRAPALAAPDPHPGEDPADLRRAAAGPIRLRGRGAPAPRGRGERAGLPEQGHRRWRAHGDPVRLRPGVLHSGAVPGRHLHGGPAGRSRAGGPPRRGLVQVPRRGTGHAESGGAERHLGTPRPQRSEDGGGGRREGPPEERPEMAPGDAVLPRHDAPGAGGRPPHPGPSGGGLRRQRRWGHRHRHAGCPQRCGL